MGAYRHWLSTHLGNTYGLAALLLSWLWHFLPVLVLSASYSSSVTRWPLVYWYQVALAFGQLSLCRYSRQTHLPKYLIAPSRSEERRVGKECRCGVCPHPVR